MSYSNKILSTQAITIAPNIPIRDFIFSVGGNKVTFKLKDKLEIVTDLTVEDSAQVILLAFTNLYDTEMHRLKVNNNKLNNQIQEVKENNFKNILEDILRKPDVI